MQTRIQIINGSLWWYRLNYGLILNSVLQINLVITGNSSFVISKCTESGLWEHVNANCEFDPLAISLDEGGYLEGKIIC